MEDQTKLEALCKWVKDVKGITKIDIFELVDYLPEFEQWLKDNNWIANYVECDLCSHKWTAVYKSDLLKLECPNCHNMVLYEVIN